MLKKLLFLILISSSIFTTDNLDEKFSLNDFDDLEFYDDDFNMEEGNLVACIYCGQFAAFIFFIDAELSGICAKCYLE